MSERVDYSPRVREAINELMRKKDATNSRTTELKPCPFCSAEPEILSDGRRTWGLVQHNDGCLFPTYPKHEIPESDFAAWNSRAERTCRNLAEPDEMSDEPFTCSECGARGPYGDGIYHIGGSMEVDGKLMFWDSWPVYKFCPHCGAKVVD